MWTYLGVRIREGRGWTGVNGVKHPPQWTDWMVTRKAEAGTAIPDSIGNYRTAVRTASGTIETAITNAADHAAFMALYDTPVDSDGNSTGNAPINDWPDEI